MNRLKTLIDIGRALTPSPLTVVKLERQSWHGRGDDRVLRKNIYYSVCTVLNKKGK